MALLVVYVLIAVGVSFVCSLLEAALLSSRIAYLREQAAAGRRGARRLFDLKRSRIDDAISAILTLNTVSNTLGATLAGAQATHVFGSARVGWFSGLLTLLILIVSEIIPKTLGAVYSRQLTSVVGHTLFWLTRLMQPVLLISGAITRLLTRGRTVTFSRGELSALISAATEDGAISGDEARMLGSLLRFNEVQVEDVMTPRTVAFMLPVDATVGDLLDASDAEVFSRIPLYRGERDNVVGYVLQRDVLRLGTGDRSTPLERFVRPISFIPDVATVGRAMTQVLERREPIAMVTDEHGGIEGLVTLEDLTETLLGFEIVDESDREVDMRDAAIKLRDRRLARMGERRQGQAEAQS